MSCNNRNKQGKPGKDGLSAYEIAVDNGFVGTEQEWLNSLKGDPGADGASGLPGQDGLNGSDGQDGQSSFTSYVFTTTSNGQPPQRPSGGSYQNPLPIEDIWTDGPTSEPGTLYLSYRIFTSYGLPPQQSQWSVPVIAADSSLVDFEWSSVEVNPGNPTDNPSNWSNTTSNTTIWMAVRTLNEGSWSSWNIVSIKGEKGDTGEPGVATAVIYAVNGSWTDAPTLDRADRYPTGWDLELPIVNIGEYVWMAQAMLNPITNQLLSNWTDPIRLSGEKGEDGVPGTNGPALAYRGDWNSSVEYRGATDLVDFVITGSPGSRDGYIARTDAGTIPAGTPVSNTTYWNGPIPNSDALFTDFFVAYSAYIDNLTVGQIRTNPQSTVVPDPNWAGESTVIGFQPTIQEDPTSVFSRHAPRGYYPSGRIGWTIAFVDQNNAITMGGETISDAFALIFYKDSSGSPIHAAFSSNLNNVAFAGSGTSYSSIVSIPTGVNPTTISDAQIDSALSSRSYLYFEDAPNDVVFYWVEGETMYRAVDVSGTFYVKDTSGIGSGNWVDDGWYIDMIAPTIPSGPLQDGIAQYDVRLIRIVGGVQSGASVNKKYTVATPAPGMSPYQIGRGQQLSTPLTNSFTPANRSPHSNASRPANHLRFGVYGGGYADS